MTPLLRDLAISLGAFVAATLLAELFGAANLGTALTFGAIAYMGTIVGLILARGPKESADPARSPRQRPRRGR
jgi:hypothetical protein